MEEEEEGPTQGSPSRLVLTELNNSPGTPSKAIDPDEMAIVQRGPWRKPVVWSPVDCDRMFDRTAREKTPPGPTQPGKMNRRLRRRLVMSPSKAGNQDVGRKSRTVKRPVF